MGLHSNFTRIPRSFSPTFLRIVVKDIFGTDLVQFFRGISVRKSIPHNAQTAVAGSGIRATAHIEIDYNNMTMRMYGEQKGAASTRQIHFGPFWAHHASKIPKNRGMIHPSI
jgi:hypothetical protein